MKKAILLTAALLLGIMLSAQTQQGYVKTKGRMVNGQIVHGQGLKGATVSIKGRAAVVVNKEDGSFSFPIPEAQFRVDSVRKKGYQLVDMDVLSMTYRHSSNPIYMVMETPEQQLQDQLDAQREIRRTLQKQLQEKQDEIESLKEQQKISDEEYRQALQKLYAEQESNEQLIKDMAKRYSELDYDQLDEFYRQVSYCIENGELVKADSLLKTKGDVTLQVEEQLKKSQAIKEQEEQLNQAKAVQAAEQDELAKRCYSFHETFKAQHLNETAAYYLELRASLDTTNVNWQHDAGLFFRVYLGNFEKTLFYFQRTLRQTLQQYGEEHPLVCSCYNSIGNLYYVNHDYVNAKKYFDQALSAIKNLVGESHPDLVTCYNNLGSVCSALGDNVKALDYHQMALEMCINLYGENHRHVATAYNNIATVYYRQKDYAKALDYMNKTLAIQQSVL